MSYLKRLTIIMIFLLGNGIEEIIAQAANSTLSLKVTNQLGEPIGNAEVILSNSSNYKKSQYTGNDGTIRFKNLSNGDYRLNISAVGFKEHVEQITDFNSGTDKVISVMLDIAPVESTVEVADEEADDFGTQTLLKSETIDKLPDNPEDLERVIRQIAGQSITGEDLPITIDGFTGGRLPPKEAIQQIRINRNIFSAQYEGPYGAGIEIFTKPDVEKVSGSLYFNFADGRFNAANPFINQRLPYQNKGYSLFLTGPLVRRKASFTLSLNHRDNDLSVPVNALTINSSLQFSSVKQFFATPARSTDAQFSVKSDLAEKHKVTIKYTFNSQKRSGQGIGDFSLPSRAYDTNIQNHVFQASHTYLADENTVSQTRFQINYTKNRNVGENNSVAINILDAFSAGGSQIDSKGKDVRFELFNDTTRQIGDFGLGFGWKIRGQLINQISRSNFGGSYTFGGRVAPVLDSNNNPLIDDNGGIVRTQISSLEAYRRTLLFRKIGYTNTQIRELGGGPTQFSIDKGNPSINISQYDVSLYGQSSYRVNKELALSFGLRYENQTNLDSNYDFSPRFGISWSPKVKKKGVLFSLPKISTGIGLFYSRFAINNTLTVRQASSSGRSQYLITNPEILSIYPEVPSITALQQSGLSKIARFIDQRTRSPLQTLFNINILKKLPNDFSVNLSYSQTRSTRQLITRNINAPLAGTFSLDGATQSIFPVSSDGNFVYRTTSEGKSHIESVTASLSIPSLKYFETSVYYSFYKTEDNLISGSGSPFDPYDFSREFSLGSIGGRHRISFFASSDLPFGLNLSSSFEISTGTRFNIVTGRDTNGDGYFTERPAFASDLTKPGLVQTKYGVLDPNPLLGDNIIPRNLGKGPTTANLDTSITKVFNFGTDLKNPKKGKYNLILTVYARNVLNINNKSNPIGNMSSPNFLRQLSYNSDGSSIIATSAGTFSGFSGRNLNFNIGFRF